MSKILGQFAAILVALCWCSYGAFAATESLKFKLHDTKTRKTTLVPGDVLGIENSTNSYRIEYTTVGDVKNYVLQGFIDSSGKIDLTTPGPIGFGAPNTGKFTTLQADSLNIVPPSGETGEMAVHEDPASDGDDWVGFKAPVNVAPGGVDGDLLWVLPSTDGTAGQVMATDGASNLSWASPLKMVTVPTAATGTCTAGSAAYDTSYIYVCIAANTWLRAPISTW